MELAIKSCFGQDAGKRAKTTGSFGTQRPRGARLCDGADWARVDGGSEFIIRTHKQRIMNKREPRFRSNRSNHWWRASL